MKSSFVKVITALSISAVVGACAGREARPISVTHHMDGQLDCASITREFEANERQILVTLKEKDDGVAKNVVLGVTGVVLFFPALFFMDPKSPERVEIEALRSRNRVLEDLSHTKKNCVMESKLDLVYKRLDGRS